MSEQEEFDNPEADGDEASFEAAFDAYEEKAGEPPSHRGLEAAIAAYMRGRE